MYLGKTCTPVCSYVFVSICIAVRNVQKSFSEKLLIKQLLNIAAVTRGKCYLSFLFCRLFMAAVLQLQFKDFQSSLRGSTGIFAKAFSHSSYLSKS